MAIDLGNSENVSRAMSLLREAAAVLAQDNSPNTSPTAPSSGLNTPSTSGTAVTPNTGPNSTSSSSTRLNSVSSTSEALQNVRTLFAPYASTSRRSTTRPVHNPPPKKMCRKQGNTRAKETWTHEVFCLANVDESSTPTRARKETLQRAGLGRSKIQFDANANAVSFKQKLEEVFPKLYGGFELLRRGSSGNGLVVIRPPASGYSAKYLRDSSGLGQALLYIRPLQMNIDISNEDIDGTDFDLEVRGLLTL